MSEFKLHHLVDELLESFERKGSPEEFTEYLQKNIAVNKSYPAGHSVAQKEVEELAKIANNRQAFLSKLEDLKQKNVDCLGPYVQLLYKISQDDSVKHFLCRTSKKAPSSTTSVAPSHELTKDDIPHVKHRLKTAVTKHSVNLESERSGLLNRSKDLVLCTPSVMSWVQRRPSMSWDFSSRTSLNISGGIGSIPVSSQENILIDDLLNILIGLPGCYIEPEELRDPFAARTFKISDEVDPSLTELVKQILPLASHFSIVQRFVEQKMGFDFGQVNNALAEAINALITDYTLFVAQLETEYRMGNLNLQKLWFYIQRNLQNMNLISSIVTTINKSDANGGKVLSLLHEYINSSIGDEKAEELCVHLMQCACVPYMKMLSMWIYKGIISDPIKEFLVEDNEVVQKEDMPVDYSADYWVKKYTVRRERIPIFLEPVSDIILRAGKYLNVIRQCGKPLSTKVETIQYKVDEKHYIQAIERAYSFASQTLLNLVLKENDLIGRLKSVKHYFLLGQGDLIVTFLSLCEKELNKDISDVIKGRLESLLDLALRLSSAVSDPYKDDLRTELLPYDLQFQMFKILSIQTTEEQDYWSSNENRSLTLIESLAFSYEVRWPLSLILNRKSLACYQMIFRHLFYCKHVERMICQVWRSNKVAKKFSSPAAQQYRNAFALRQRMLHCVQNLEYHMMVEVIEPHWCMFLQKISKVNNVDEILSCHCDFLDACLKDCMLTIPVLLSTITKILSICVNFCKFMQLLITQRNGKLLCDWFFWHCILNCTNWQRTQRYFVEAELGSLPNSFYESYHQQDVPIQNSQIDEQEIESFEDRITRFNVEFTAALMQLLDQINDLNRDTSDHDRLFNLLYRFDFNSFYSGQFEKMELARLKIDSSG